MLNKRILIIQGEIPSYRIPFFNALGGRHGISLYVVYSGKPLENAPQNFTAIHVKKIRLGGLKFQFLPFFRLGNFDCVIIPLDVSWLSSVLACWLRRLTGNFLLWGHGLGKSGFSNRLRKLLLSHSNGVILYGDERLNEIRPYTDKIFIAPNTVEILSPEFNGSNPRSTFLYVGRLQQRKRIDDLLTAFSMIVDEIPASLKIEIVGGDDLLLREKVKNHRLSGRVSFLGEIRDDRLLKPVFHRALAYVSPGHVGLGVLHSFAFGVPVVTREKASHAPEFYNLIHQHNALLYDGSVDMLAATLLRLIKEKELSRQLGYNGYLLYRDSRTMDNMVNGFLQAIR